MTRVQRKTGNKSVTSMQAKLEQSFSGEEGLNGQPQHVAVVEKKVTQADLVKRVVYRLSLTGPEPVVRVRDVVDEALLDDLESHGGRIFHGGKTPECSARRALYSVVAADVLVIRDGRGQLRFRADALRDVVLQGDAWEILELIPDGVISCIIADPPWTHLAEHRNKGQTTRMTTNSYFEERDVDGELMREFFRVLKPGGYLALYAPPFQRTALRIWITMLSAVEDAGFDGVRRITWHKDRSMGYRWTTTTEPVFCFVKPLPGGRLPPCDDRKATDYVRASAPRGKKRTPFMDYTEEDQAEWDRLVALHGKPARIPREERKRLKGRYHDTEKPVDVARHVLRVAKDPGGIMMEVFAGTGHACVAASEFGMSFLAVELSERVVTHCLVPRMGGRVRGVVHVQGAVARVE